MVSEEKLGGPKGPHYISLMFATALVAQAPAPSKVDIVSVTGCLRQRAANEWVVVAATDPVPSIANAPAPKELPATIPAGKNEFRLIGVSEFALPEHKDHTVVIRGLLIKAAPVSRLNVTSIATAAQSCAPGAGK
jgi:hypothetical protein